MTKLKDLLKAQDLLKEGNFVVCTKAFEGAEAVIRLNGGKHPTAKRSGRILDIGLKNGEIVIDYEMECEQFENGSFEVWGEAVGKELKKSWCYLNQVIFIKENDGTIWELNQEPYKMGEV